MMVARLQRLLVVLLWFAALGAFALGAALNRPAVGACFAALILSSHCWVLVAELSCLACVEDSATRPALFDMVHAWWGETIETPCVFYWRQPFRAAAEPDMLPIAPNQRRGILLIHGLLCNRGFWTPWQTKFRQLGISSLALTLEPIFGPIESHATAIDEAVRRLTAATGVPPVVVAHSMGGLAIRHWLATQGGSLPVHRVITIGTPHRGTWMARFARGSNGRQMVIGNEWLSRLDAATSASGCAAQFTCFYGDCDNVVFPATHAQLPGADNRRIARTAHVALAFHEQVFSEALHWLDLAAAAQPNFRSLAKTSLGPSSPSDETRR